MRLLLSLALSLPAVLPTTARAEIHDDIKGEWTTGFLSDPSGFIQTRFKLSLAEPACKLTADVLINHPLGQAGLRMEMDCEYSVGAAASSVGGAYSVDYKYLRQRMTLLTQSMVDDYNEEKQCGFNDWRVGVPRDVTGLDCDGDTFAADTMSYDLVKLGDKGELHVGLIPDDGPVATTPADRPKELDPYKIFYRPGSEPDGGGTGGATPPDVLPGFYRVMSHTANTASCAGEGPAAADQFAFFELYANSTVVLGVPGWSLQPCGSVQECQAADNQILIQSQFPVHEAKGEGAWTGKVVANSWFGSCQAEITLADTTRAADGSLTIVSRVFKGTIPGAKNSDDCSRLAHAVDPLQTPQLACGDYRVLKAAPVQP